ncbi:MAG: flippase [Candidatus Aenigmatarchaeota archaeon]|nr:MAG: flippase [Candidatus Aenigmarchaeota archaeon]
MAQETEDIQSLKKIVKGAGWIFIGMIISKILSIVYRVFIARYFGPGDYGLFALGLVVLSFVGMIARLGLHSGVVRYVPFYEARGDKARVKGIVLSALKIITLVSVVMAFFMFIFSEEIAVLGFHNMELVGILQILALSVPFVCLFYVFNFSFVGFQKLKYQVYSEHIFSNIAKIVFVVVFGLLGLGVYGIAWSYTIAAILTLFLSAYFLQKRVFPVFKTGVKPIYMNRKLLSFSIPLLFAGFMSFIISSIDTLMLGYFKTVTDVGVYNAAAPTAYVLNVIPGALTVIFLPIITGLYSKGKIKELYSVYKTVFKWMFYFNIPLLAVMMAFPGQIINILFGIEYAGYAGVSMTLLFLSVGTFLVGISIFFSNVLSMLEKTKHILYIIIAAAIVNLLLNWLLIPTYGIGGAAFASMITHASSVALMFLVSWYYIRMVPASFGLIKSILAAMISIILVNTVARLFITDFVYFYVPLLVVFLFLYGFLILIFKGLGSEDVEILRSIREKVGLRVRFLEKIIKKFI